jgi:hypothetical protein
VETRKPRLQKLKPLPASVEVRGSGIRVAVAAEVYAGCMIREYPENIGRFFIDEATPDVSHYL